RTKNTTAAEAGTKSRAMANNGSSAVVDINTASQSELDSLPGIGPAMAKRIIAEREKARFTSVDDLQRVKGIGPAKLAKLRSRIKVN
ncbi:protein containing Competence protein ComEA, helix-hairpin-helix region domain protein, partial [gut metagenome]